MTHIYIYMMTYREPDVFEDWPPPVVTSNMKVAYWYAARAHKDKQERFPLTPSEFNEQLSNEKGKVETSIITVEKHYVYRS